MKASKAFILFSFLFLSCMQGPSIESTLNTDFSYGSSFGFCVGPCYKEIKISGETLTFVVKTRDGANLEEVTFTEKVTSSDIEIIENSINYAGLTSYENVLGCPDCADGGAEWLEISNGSKDKKRVTIEYGKSFGTYNNLLEYFRKRQTELAAKYLK